MPKSVKKPLQPEITPLLKNDAKKIIIIVALCAVLIGILTAGVYFYFQFQSGQKVAGVTTIQEVDRLVEKVGKLVELPKEERVTLATVSDISKLKDQPFFSQSQNGDKVLIYEQSKKAILYRPSTNKIIEIGPVTGVGQQTSELPSLPAINVTESIRIALYNGTERIGLTNIVERQLLALSSLQVEVVAKENASSSAYSESLVIDLKGSNTNKANQLATAIKGKVASLPTGETEPLDADILIILGSTYASQE